MRRPGDSEIRHPKSAIRTWKGRFRFEIALYACLGLAMASTEGEAQERRPPPGRDETGTDARMLADLEILRDLELLRQLDLLRKMDDVRTEPPPRGAKTNEKGKP
ncbi:MAG: hypothetical protein HY713_02525 [candidate division NC10 bacterium]|nr:hypothetical protein [candidate division NC10 bacterium]